MQRSTTGFKTKEGIRDNQTKIGPAYPDIQRRINFQPCGDIVTSSFKLASIQAESEITTQVHKVYDACLETRHSKGNGVSGNILTKVIRQSAYRKTVTRCNAGSRIRVLNQHRGGENAAQWCQGCREAASAQLKGKERSAGTETKICIAQTNVNRCIHLKRGRNGRTHSIQVASVHFESHIAGDLHKVRNRCIKAIHLNEQCVRYNFFIEGIADTANGQSGCGCNCGGTIGIADNHRSGIQRSKITKSRVKGSAGGFKTEQRVIGNQTEVCPTHSNIYCGIHLTAGEQIVANSFNVAGIQAETEIPA